MFALVALVFVWQEARSDEAFRRVRRRRDRDRGEHRDGRHMESVSPAFDAHVQRSLLVLDGSQHSVDEAAAGRLRIWRTACANDRGASGQPASAMRGFRYAYPQFAERGDTFVDLNGDEGASHAHQIVLEILSENRRWSGLILWLLGTFVAMRAWLRAERTARERAFAPALALKPSCAFR